MLTLTNTAQEQIKTILANEATKGSVYEYIRVAIIGGGCSGFQYKLTMESVPDPKDQILEFGEQREIKILVDPRSAVQLDETEIDYLETPLKSGFQFKNSKATHTCGCGESFDV